MGWDKGGRYYTRSRRVNGRVFREYVGGGEVGRLVARVDARDRAKRLAARTRERAARAELARTDQPLLELGDLAGLLAHAALLAAGFHQHHRGEWRKTRG